MGRRVRGTGHLTHDGYIQHEQNGKRYYEHRRVVEDLLGRPLTKDEVVHHKNGVRDDNRPENLEVMNHGDHAKMHASERLQEKDETWILEASGLLTKDEDCSSRPGVFVSWMDIQRGNPWKT